MTADRATTGPAWRRRGWWLWPAVAAMAGALAVVGIVVEPGLAGSAAVPGNLDVGTGRATPAPAGARPAPMATPAGRPAPPPTVIVVSPSRPVVGEDGRGVETGDGGAGEAGGG